MFKLTNVPFRVLMAAEKIIGKNIITLSQKEEKSFEDLRDFAFVARYSEDQTFTLAQADEMTIEQVNAANGIETEVK